MKNKVYPRDGKQIHVIYEKRAISEGWEHIHLIYEKRDISIR